MGSEEENALHYASAYVAMKHYTKNELCELPLALCNPGIALDTAV